MSQEARNTERHTAAWGATRLRDQAINFVSAGNLVRNELDTPPDDTKQPSEQESPTSSENSPDVGPSAEPTSPPREQHAEIVPAPLSGEGDLVKEDNHSQRRDSILSQSSEEIVFKGRLNGGGKPARSPHAPTASPMPTKSPTPEEPIPEVPSSSSIPSPPPTSTDPDPYANIYSTERKRFDRRGRPMGQTSNSKEERLIMEDYIANMNLEDDDDENDSDEERGEPRHGNEHYRFYDGSAEANVKVQTRRQSPPTTKDNVDQAIDWNSTDLEDFDEFSTTDEDVAEVSQVLRRRERPSGVQYLVTGIGQVASDAKWVLGERLKTHSALEEIRIYKDIQAMKVLESTEDTSDTSDSDDDEHEDHDGEALGDLANDIESEDDENERIFKRTARMTDEQIARVLAKQEELGIGGDELLIFDGQTDEPDDFDSPPDFIPFSTSRHVSNRTKSKQNRRRKDHFPPAEAFADALEQDPYGAFDIMDFDRPSLRPKKKGRKTDLPFDLGVEDDDLAEMLRTQWHKDRDKKASRRREKQAEREAALLDAGERNRPDAIKAEIRRFLASETESLELAPMDSALRASVHRLAKALKLNSRSQGKDGHGIGRFPVLTKTSGTRRYTIDTVWEVDNLMNLRKFFPRQQGGSYRGPNAVNGPGVARARRGGGGVMSGATYMNGEVVGASAPEIGAENKGRAMLEKMGWTSGMGIGAIGNKGGIDVIKHVVKTTKAGLG